MGDNYTYKDGSAVVVDAGEHGLNICLPNDTSNVLQSVPPEGDYHAQFEVRPPIDPHAAPVVARQGRATNDYNSLHTSNLVEFISFGHSHLYPAEQYPKVAPHWREQLFAEARILSRALQGDQAIAYEFLNGDGSLGAWLTDGIAGAIDFFTRRPIPKPEEYDPLMKRVWDVCARLKAATAADYEVLHWAGLEFMHIRYEEEVIRKKVHDRIEDLIGAAHLGQRAAEETEGAAFWVLDLYGQATCKDPASLFAYRFGVLTLRAGARGTGALIADDSARAAFHEAAGVIRTDLPKAATGLLMGSLKRTFPKSGPMETFAQQLISIQLFIFFFAIDYAVFDADKVPPGKGERAFLEKIAEPLAEQIVSAIAAILVANKLQDLPSDSPLRKQVERLGAVIPAIINSTMQEIVKMKQIADAEKRPFWNVFTSEGGWALVRIIRDAGKALLEAPVQSAMERQHAADKQYYRALILSITLYISPVDPSKVKAPQDQPAFVSLENQKQPPPDQAQAPGGSGGPGGSRDDGNVTVWNAKMPRTKSGPDANGNIGIAKLKPVAGDSASPDTSTPPVPAKAVIKKVKKVRDTGWTPTNAEKLKAVLPDYPTMEAIYADPVVKAKIANGDIKRDHHLLAVLVRDPQNKTIKQWWEISETRVALGSATYLGHTEQKALARIGLMNLEPGSHVVFVGYLQPCNLKGGCSKVMEDFARQTGIPIEYRAAYADDERTIIPFDPVDGRTTQDERKQYVLNQ